MSGSEHGKRKKRRNENRDFHQNGKGDDIRALIVDPETIAMNLYAVFVFVWYVVLGLAIL